MSDYDLDFHAWSKRQGALLRRIAAGERVNDTDVDWPNIAEEIETLARSERAAVASRIATIIEHLIKLEASSATAPRAGWRMTIRRSRIEIDELLRDNPSIRRLLGRLVARELPIGRKLAVAAFDEYGETLRADPQRLTYTKDQVLGDWFPHDAD